MQHGFVTLPFASWGLQPDGTLHVTDLLSNETYHWRGPRNYVRLDPELRVAHILLARLEEALPEDEHSDSRFADGRAVADGRRRSSEAGLRRTSDCHHVRHVEYSVVQGRDHLPGARPSVLRQHERRRRRLRRPDAEARLPREPRHQHALAAPLLPVAAPRRRVRHRGLREHPSELRHAGRLRPASSRKRTAAASASSPSSSSTTRRTSTRGSRRRAARRPDRRSGTSTSGATPTRSTRASGSSSPTPRRRTGRWDDTAKAYYWHRFFHHQPDLNFDNPAGARRR